MNKYTFKPFLLGLLGLAIIALSLTSCASSKKMGCPVVYNATIEEKADTAVISEKLGVITFDDKTIHIEDNVYNIMFTEGPNQYYCVNAKTLQRCKINMFCKNDYKIVSLYGREVNKYYILYPEKDYPFKTSGYDERSVRNSRGYTDNTLSVRR